MHNTPPCLVQTLIPDTRRVRHHHALESPTAHANCSSPALEYCASMVRLYKIHLVQKAEDAGIGGMLSQGVDNGGVGGEVGRRGRFERTGFDIEDIYENAHAAEDVGFLCCQVGFCKCVLAVRVYRVLAFALLVG